MLETRNLYAGYVPGEWILEDVNLILPTGGRMAVLGQNGSGKSTLSKAIMGMVPFVKGDILFNDEKINGLKPNQMAERGIVYFFQGGRVFPNLTVMENLRVAGRRLSRSKLIDQIDRIEPHFKLLGRVDRSSLNAGYLSGGERHQLALAMCLVACPNIRCMIADEPSAGLSPSLIENFFIQIKEFFLDENKDFLLIEQNAVLLKKLSFDVFLL